MLETIVQNTRRVGPTNSIAKTYGLAKMAGTVKPTMNLSTSHDVKFHASELNPHDRISNIK